MTRFPTLSLLLCLSACSSTGDGLSGGDAGAGKPKPGGATDAAAAAGDAAKKPPGGGGTTTTITPVVGVPRPGSLTTPVAGGGPAGLTPLMPGCTAASADECPTVSGKCATSGGTTTKTITFGVMCLFGGEYTYSPYPGGLLEYIHETANGQDYYRIRLTFATSFVDNTYGANAIGWGDKGHTFKDLVGSDHAEIQLYDSQFNLVSDFKLDYISLDATAPCGYRSLGVSGGEGKMLFGDAKYILSASTSFSRNLNGCGYCKSAACNGDCTVDSPLTDDNYTPNSVTPNYDYRVQYEVWVDAAVFGANGFGGVAVNYIHASPSKSASGNTIIVVPRPCPPADGCEPGTVTYLTAEGAVGCTPDVPNGPCPTDYTELLTSEGKTLCVPGTTPPGTTPPDGGNKDAGRPGSDAGLPCVEGSIEYLTSEGKPVCVPVPPGNNPCADGSAKYVTSEGAVCLPIPTGGDCPDGFHLDPASEGKICI